MSTKQTKSDYPQVDTFDRVKLRHTFIGIAALVVGSIFTVWMFTNWKEIREGFIPFRGNKENITSTRMSPPLSPAPRLQVDENGDIAKYRAGQKHILESYDWVNEKDGVVRIPIQQAMDKLLEKGFPAKGAKP